MTRQPMLRRRRTSRWALGLLGVAAALLASPVATAQPDVDAGNAITATWQATGGDTGPLGPVSGDVYPIGAGFAQNFASGKVFFTPATGAHFMQGAILEKYESLGGPADGDLGFPTIDEGPGRAPNSVNSTFSASDNPVIFWTPDTGAHVVRGPINAAWDRLGGSSGTLGVPSEDETYDGAVVTQKFTGGQISYDGRTKKFTTAPADLAGQLADLSVPDDPVAAINAARRAAGGPLGPLGASDGEPYKIGSDGLGQNFVNGKIFYSPATGANVVTGQVLEKYESVGGPEGDLGFPVTGEVDGGVAPASRMSSFAAADKPVIFWTPDYGAVIVRGALNAGVGETGRCHGHTRCTGVPIRHRAATRSPRSSVAARSPTTPAPSDSAPSRRTSLRSSSAWTFRARRRRNPRRRRRAATPDRVTGVRWEWWWLLAIIPVLLILAVVGLAIARRRGPRSR
ncbi:LGFP repeat-containing protein [Mycobacterium kyogaense]|uniref:LGFP repeat-containing protein n=1 Tax=Mycobacterium kyogaense TaxID=2212479 RepID=UPI003FA59661